MALRFFMWVIEYEWGLLPPHSMDKRDAAVPEGRPGGSPGQAKPGTARSLHGPRVKYAARQ